MPNQSADMLLQSFRNKVTRNIVWAGAATQFLLAGAQIWLANYLQAVIMFAAAIVLAVIAYSYREKRIPDFWRVIFMMLLTSICFASIRNNGTIGVYWAYPLLVASFFMFRDGFAIALASAVTMVMSTAALMYMPVSDGWRISASLLVILVLGSVFVVMLGRMQKLLHQLVITDTLTGLQNRHRLNNVLSQLIHNFRRYHRAASLIMLDLDHFKLLNDKHGHLFGDQMLKQLAARLKASLRVNDQLFRVGGEEFLVVMPETELGEAVKVAEKLRRAVENTPFEGKDAQAHLTVSLGVAQLRAEQTWAEWINTADTALLEAKRKGRNQVCKAESYTPTA
ncbi:GGDEF domain-containing protein [Pseudidiomarina andamanensis]|uniref:diguanylate cyclase n=1 Tax=Pseudidiomarina andamanensis TaxID=1940690 RepID=A0AA92EU93_9GAMM|nr:GGDEF domain-containing protein [Pseudidiomarina andamanensis]MDS0218976.1 GGDEF domain-containing protein [Pseudidiomarina andamanensis]QGT96334.1 GGDEF domain-containing protein [Pseudidiomarina andamanensis]